MISCLADFISNGSALNRDSRMVLRFTGDATHDKSKQRLKKMVLGVGGSHFVKGQWRNTIIPIMYVVCAQESTKCLELGLAALDAVLESRFGFKLNDVVAEWYWDGRPEAMTVLAKHFEGKPGHLCLQHAKKQIGARFGKGFSHEVKKGIDLMALMPNPLFHAAAEPFLVNLKDGGHQKGVEYLTTAATGHAFIAVGEFWTAKWQSNYMHVSPGFSTYLNNAVEASHRSDAIATGLSKTALTESLFTNARNQTKFGATNECLRMSGTCPLACTDTNMTSSVARGACPRKLACTPSNTADSRPTRSRILCRRMSPLLWKQDVGLRSYRLGSCRSGVHMPLTVKLCCCMST